MRTKAASVEEVRPYSAPASMELMNISENVDLNFKLYSF